MKILSAVQLDQHHNDEIARIAPKAEIVQIPAGYMPRTAETLDWIDTAIKNNLDAEILITGILPREKPEGSSIRWIQLSSAGVDRDQSSPYWNSEVDITSAVGVHGLAISEWILLGLLSRAHKAREAFAYQAEGRWGDRTKLRADLLTGKTVGLYGFGSIGREVARLCKVLNMNIIVYRPEHMGTTSRPRFVHPALEMRGGPAPDYSDVTVVDMQTMLADSDYLVVTAPYTEETAGSIGREQLEQMKSDACVVVASRGGIVDETALANALAEESIGYAVLDVYEQEPLVAESPLWGLSNVLLFPHVSGTYDGYYNTVIQIFLVNLEDYLKQGVPRLNVVDAAKGY